MASITSKRAYGHLTRLLAGGLSLLLQACAYSFRSGALPTDIRTLTVAPLTNEAAIVLPTLTQTLAEALRQKFIAQSSLSLVTEKGDLVLYGRITDFKLAPVAIQGSQQAAQNRLSITLVVKCTCPKYPALNWEQSFMNFADFPASQPLSAVQEALITDICDRIAQDVVNKTLSTW